MESPKIDVEKVMEQIRENVRKRRQEFPPSKATSPLPTDQDVADLTSLHRIMIFILSASHPIAESWGTLWSWPKSSYNSSSRRSWSDN